MPKEYLVIGHLTKDITDKGISVGGTAYYGARTVRILGQEVAAVTAFGPDLPAHDLESHGVEVTTQHSTSTTQFSNEYSCDGARRQRVAAVAAPIIADTFPAILRHSPTIHLAPVVGECSPDLLTIFKSAKLKAATLQGWLRKIDCGGEVVPFIDKHLYRKLSNLNVAIFSDEDATGLAGFRDAVTQLIETVVVTHGSRGATLYSRGAPFYIEPIQVYSNVDPTGAGDVFAAAFIALLARRYSPQSAAQCANFLAGEFVRDRFDGVEAAWRTWTVCHGPSEGQA